MWYASSMHQIPQSNLEAAEAAVVYAQSVRKFHRRRTKSDSQQRAQDTALALQRLHEAMKPLKAEIGRFAYYPQTDIAIEQRAHILELSAAMQRERRKIWKMTRKAKDV